MIQRKYIKTHPDLPAIASPISHAVVSGDYCHTSGQIVWDKSGRFIPGTVLKETKNSFKNIFAVLKSAGFTKEDIVFIDMAFTDLNDLRKIARFYESLFKKDKYPARTVQQVTALAEGAKVKVLAIAVKATFKKHSNESDTDIKSTVLHRYR